MVLAAGFARLDIAVAGFRTGGFHAKGKNQRIVGYKLHTLSHVVGKSLLVQYQLVGGSHHNAGVRVSFEDSHVRPSQAWSRISEYGFYQQVLLIQFGQLFSDNRCVISVRTYKDVFLRH